MFVKYLSVGVFNTILTFIITIICYKLLNIDYKIAYATGYLAGFLSSLILNNIYTFKNRRNKFNFQYFSIFTFFFVISFLISEIALIFFIEILLLYKLISVVLSMGIYTLISYYLFNKFVYKNK